MAINYRVSAQVRVLSDAYGTDRYPVEKEVYWKIFEEEFKKEPLNGWAAWEDPSDCLKDSIDCGDDKAWVAEVLADYKRFYKITGWAVDEDLLRAAEEYIA